MYLKVYGINFVWNIIIFMLLDFWIFGYGMYLNIELLGYGLVFIRCIGFVSVNFSDIFFEGFKGVVVYS